MAVKVILFDKAAPVKLLHPAGEDGYVYDDWSLTEASRKKMQAKWSELEIPMVDLAAKEFASATSKKDSHRDGFVGWRDDIQEVSVASAKLMRALKGCAFPAQHTLGKLEGVPTDVPLYDHAVEVVAALIDVTDQLKASAQGVDARRFPHPLPNLIIKLARELRCAGLPWDSKFKSALVMLTTMTLDGLNLRHSHDIRSSVRDVLNSGDSRLDKLR